MIHLRPLRFWRDWWLCWTLARDETERAMARDPRMPTLWGHTRWMLRQRFSRNHAAWVICVDMDRVGLVRLDSDLEISIVLLPGARGQGIGTKVLADVGWRALAEGVNIVAHIKAENKASLRAFRRAGFVIVDSKGFLLKLRYAGPKEMAA